MCVELFFVPKLPRLERTNFKTEKKRTGHGTESSSMRITCNTFSLPSRNILHYVTNGLYVTPLATQQVPMLGVRKKEDT